VNGYSARKTSMGSKEAARRAGTYAAQNAQSPRVAATATSVGKSHESTPKSRPRISVAEITAQISPTLMPIAINNPASFRMS